eukprot:gnl/Chilomastix_cuspidata/3721.p1 GENE.gnl/Chilomastix_cuspidata/3721~~gnl/Chilomastix_cuspidata/3721.p1  ORF type:complete len:1018 (-),score=223.60 gnl/Chilomastix_cuspidata/3721:1527-4298(-)
MCLHEGYDASSKRGGKSKFAPPACAVRDLDPLNNSFDVHGNILEGRDAGNSLHRLNRMARSQILAQRISAFLTLEQIALKARKGQYGTLSQTIQRKLFIMAEKPTEAECPVSHICVLAMSPRNDTPKQVQVAAVSMLKTLLCAGNELEALFLRRALTAGFSQIPSDGIAANVCTQIWQFFDQRANEPAHGIPVHTAIRSEGPSKSVKHGTPPLPFAYIDHLIELELDTFVAHWLRVDPTVELCCIAQRMIISFTDEYITRSPLPSAIAYVLDQALDKVNVDSEPPAPPYLSALLTAAEVCNRGQGLHMKWPREKLVQFLRTITTSVARLNSVAVSPNVATAHSLTRLLLCGLRMYEESFGRLHPAILEEVNGLVSSLPSNCTFIVMQGMSVDMSSRNRDRQFRGEAHPSIMFALVLHLVRKYLSRAARDTLENRIRFACKNAPLAPFELCRQCPVHALLSGTFHSAATLGDIAVFPERLSHVASQGALAPLFPTEQPSPASGYSGASLDATIQNSCDSELGVFYVPPRFLEAELLPRWVAAVWGTVGDRALCPAVELIHSLVPTSGVSLLSLLSPLALPYSSSGNFLESFCAGFPERIEHTLGCLLEAAARGCPSLVLPMLSNSLLLSSLFQSALDSWREGYRIPFDPLGFSFVAFCQVVANYPSVTFLPFALIRSWLDAGRPVSEQCTAFILRFLSLLTRLQAVGTDGRPQTAVPYSFLDQHPAESVDLITKVVGALVGNKPCEAPFVPRPFHAESLSEMLLQLIDWAKNESDITPELSQAIICLAVHPLNSLPAVRVGAWKVLAEIPVLYISSTQPIPEKDPQVRNAIFQSLHGALGARRDSEIYRAALISVRHCFRDPEFEGDLMITIMDSLDNVILTDLLAPAFKGEPPAVMSVEDAIVSKCGLAALQSARGRLYLKNE